MPWGDGKQKKVKLSRKESKEVLRNSGGHSTGGGFVKVKHVNRYADTHHRGRSTEE